MHTSTYINVREHLAHVRRLALLSNRQLKEGHGKRRETVKGQLTTIVVCLDYIPPVVRVPEHAHNMSACASVGELERICDPRHIHARHRLGDVTFDIHTRMYSRQLEQVAPILG